MFTASHRLDASVLALTLALPAAAAEPTALDAPTREPPLALHGHRSFPSIPNP